MDFDSDSEEAITDNLNQPRISQRAHARRRRMFMNQQMQKDKRNHL